MLQWIKTHKNIIIVSGIILLTLTAAFVFGGPGVQSAPGPQDETEASTDSGREISVGQEAAGRTTEAVTGTAEKGSSSQAESGTSEEGRDNHGTEAPDTKASESGEATVTEDFSVTEVTETPTTEAPQEVTFACSLSITCEVLLEQKESMDPAKAELVPANGVILGTTTVTVTEGESVYDVLRRTCTNAGISLDASVTPVYGTAYIRGIQNIYEFDCGSLSGWKYRVNGTVPNYGCSSYILQEGDSIQFYFTTNVND